MPGKRAREADFATGRRTGGSTECCRLGVGGAEAAGHLGVRVSTPYRRPDLASGPLR